MDEFGNTRNIRKLRILCTGIMDYSWLILGRCDG